MDKEIKEEKVVGQLTVNVGSSRNNSWKYSMENGINNGQDCKEEDFGQRILAENNLEKGSKQLHGSKWRTAAGKVKFGRGTKTLLGKLRANSVMKSSGEDNDDSQSSNCHSEEAVKEEVKETSGWKEHVWSTFIDRGFSDDVTEIEEKIVGKQLLSKFQQEKFRHFFYHVLDLNSDHVISAEDFDGLNERVRHYMGWSVNTLYYLALREVHSLFLDFFLLAASELVQEDSFDFCDPFKTFDPEEEAPVKTSVSIDEWVNVWGGVVGKARKIDDLPMWLQFYPKTLFDTINRSCSGIITKNELKLFYTAFLDAGKLGDFKLMELTEKSFNAMTSNGDVELSFHIYKLSFLNFLLGKQPNGPGQFMFGCVDGASCKEMFPIDYGAVTNSMEKRRTLSEENREETSSRKSVFV